MMDKDMRCVPRCLRSVAKYCEKKTAVRKIPRYRVREFKVRKLKSEVLRCGKGDLRNGAISHDKCYPMIKFDRSVD